MWVIEPGNQIITVFTWTVSQLLSDSLETTIHFGEIRNID